MYTGLKIDWSQSKAAPQRAVHVYVNLKGRDPQGIVEPEDYENVRQEIIDAYLAYIDPETGKRPFAMALRREDARPFGCYGDGVGDVIYAIYPWFGGQHGNHLPTAEWGIGTLKGLLVMNGPDFKAGDTLTRTAWITDVVPTICHIMDLPMPDGAEGAILYQALKDPNSKLKEMNRLKKALGKIEK
jgi:predicted AlkP superfamily phosphohydrolase/phosphomutase